MESIKERVRNLADKKPRFLEESAGAAERGTATHLFLQFCDMNNLRATEESVKQEIGRLVSNQYLSADIAKLIRINEILNFTKSKLFSELVKSQRIHRELRFNVFIPATEFTTQDKLKSTYFDKEILVQGVIDLCFFSSDGQLILCDYKTDRIPREIYDNYEKIKQMFITSHKQQLKYYSYAVQSIFGRTPDRILIYSLAYGDSFQIDL